jgi:hypothetical protein
MVVRVSSQRESHSDSGGWRLLKWSLMVAVVGWTLVYRLGLETSSLTEFRYVNF